jgi:hydroxyacyl-ACP dehydratase HTD2-like protein with hotdog domain
MNALLPVAPGPIPELVIVPDTVQMFMFSAATWNRHRIHYDHAWAVREGHRSVVAQRALLGNFLARMLEGWLGDRGAVRELSWRVVSSAVAGSTLRCCGTARHSEGGMGRARLRCELSVLDADGGLIATGYAMCEVRDHHDQP